MKFYFAYGSNMDEEQMRQRGLVVKGKFPGVLHGWHLAFNKVAGSRNAGYANIEHYSGADVQGIIYETDDSSIRKLDKYEGYPSHYHREKVTVHDRAGHDIRCTVYVANQEMTEQNLAPAKSYLRHLLSGSHCLSKEYIDFLSHVSTVS